MKTHLLSLASLFIVAQGMAQYGQNLDYNGNNKVLNLDVYEPTGDTASLRPLIIFAPGGNFITADKTQGDIVPLCKDFAKMGYVCAAITYRVGFPSLPFGAPDSIEGFQAVMRATQDARAAVRFFRRDVSEWGNRFKVDTSRIFYAGSSAGGFTALHLAFFDDVNELASWMDTTASGLGGGVEGLSGNPGYSSKVKAVINISGALGDTAWMHTGDTPVLSFHGDQDGVVPFYSDIIYLLGTYPIMTVDGSNSVHIRANNVGINNCFKPYWGADHTPHWGSGPGVPQYYDTTFAMMKHWLMQFVCNTPALCEYTPSDSANFTLCNPNGLYWDTIFSSVTLSSNVAAGISTGKSDEGLFRVFPNPADEQFTAVLPPNSDGRLMLYDAPGHLIRTINPSGAGKLVIPRKGLPAGIYILHYTSADFSAVRRVVLK